MSRKYWERRVNWRRDKDESMALARKVKGIGQSSVPCYAVCIRKCRFTFHVCVEFPSVFNR